MATKKTYALSPNLRSVLKEILGPMKLVPLERTLTHEQVVCVLTDHPGYYIEKAIEVATNQRATPAQILIIRDYLFVALVAAQYIPEPNLRNAVLSHDAGYPTLRMDGVLIDFPDNSRKRRPIIFAQPPKDTFASYMNGEHGGIILCDRGGEPLALQAPTRAKRAEQR